MSKVQFPSFTKTYHHKPYPAIDPTQPELSAAGRVVLVTGSGSGIGQATAIAFARAHAKVIVLVGRRLNTLQETKEKIESQGLRSQVVCHTCDISSEDQVQSVFHSVMKEHGPIDVCVHGASHLSDKGKLYESSLTNFWTSMEINIKGSFIINKAFVNQSGIEGRERALIFMNSFLAHMDAPSQKTAPASYAMGKLAQAKMVEYSAIDNEHNKHFRTYAVQPGIVPTEMSDKSIDMAPPGTREALEWDDPFVPGQFFVWLASPKGACIPSGKYLWANWDVEELEARKDEIASNPLCLTQTMHGWPFEYRG